MKIKELKISNFQGLDGKREYSFPAKITAFAMPNGSGKTSILNALRFGLTGSSGDGITISGKADKADVGIILEDGTYIIREITREGENRFWYNRKTITKPALDKAITAVSGIETGILKTVTASEILGNMKPQDLGNLMLGYIPETLNEAGIESYVPDLTGGMQTMLKEVLPEGTFGTKALDAAYKRLYKMRTAAKKVKTDLEATIRVLNNTPMPKEGMEALEKMLADLKKQQEELTVYRTKQAEYEKTLSRKKDLEEKKKDLTDQIKSIPNADFSADQHAKLQKELEEIQKNLDEVKRLIATLTGSKTALDKALKTLDTPTCPLSDKLKCTTDKTPVRSELTEASRQTEQEIEVQKKKLSELAGDIAKATAQIRAMEDARVASVKKESLEKSLKDVEEQLAQMKLEEPKKPDELITGITENEVRSKLDAIKAYEKADAVKTELTSAEQKVEDLEKLCSALEPKGIVRNSVTKAYISAFEASVNTRAAQLKPGMRMKFVQRDGIIPMLDVNGKGLYYPYHSLSGGEKIFMVFLLLDMLNQMCGLKILLLDELSVLDAANFKALIGVLNAVEDYDQVFITTVDHESLVKALKAVKDINVVETL